MGLKVTRLVLKTASRKEVPEDEWEKESNSQPEKRRVKRRRGVGGDVRILERGAGVAGDRSTLGWGSKQHVRAGEPPAPFHFMLAFAWRFLFLSVPLSLPAQTVASPRELGKSSVSLLQMGGGTRPRSILIKQTYCSSLLTPPVSTRLINYSTTPL